MTANEIREKYAAKQREYAARLAVLRARDPQPAEKIAALEGNLADCARWIQSAEQLAANMAKPPAAPTGHVITGAGGIASAEKVRGA